LIERSFTALSVQSISSSSDSGSSWKTGGVPIILFFLRPSQNQFCSHSVGFSEPLRNTKEEKKLYKRLVAKFISLIEIGEGLDLLDLSLRTCLN
jgi:hypothetical protein